MLLKSFTVASLAVVLFAGKPASAMAGESFMFQQHTAADSTPPKEKIFDSEALERAMREVDRARESLERQAEQLRKQAAQQRYEWKNELPDAARMQAEMNAALQQIDKEKLRAEVHAAMQQADLQRLQEKMANMKNLVKEKDLTQIKLAMQQAMRETNKAMRAFKGIHQEEVQRALENAKGEMYINREKMQEAIERTQHYQYKNLQKDIERSLHKAQQQVQRSKEALQGYREMVDNMDAEGLINKKGSYSIDYKDGQLFINDQQQPATVTEKYKRFFKGERFTIKHDKDEGKKTIVL